jgi:hypothetical protein
METAYTREDLLAALTECHEADPSHFVTLPKQVLDSSQARMALADLRNQGMVEEQIRGVVRLTRLGYALCQRDVRHGRHKVRLAV